MNSSQQRMIKNMFEKGILVSKEFIEEKEILEDDFLEKIEMERDLLVINLDYFGIISRRDSIVDWYEIDKYRVWAEKKQALDLYQQQLEKLYKTRELLQEKEEILKTKLITKKPEPPELLERKSLIEEKRIKQKPISPLEKKGKNRVEIVISHENIPHKYEIKDFTNFFISRYRFLEAILSHRQELQNILTINRILGKKERESVSIIGLVEEISITANGNLIVTLEDITGKIKVLFSKNKPELLAEAKDLVNDEVVGISGFVGDKIIFAEGVIWPDFPSNNEMRKSENEEAAIFLSDVHVGSKLFLKKTFRQFLQWIKGEAGNEEQQEMAKKVRYIFIAGDLVDGVGVYPNQEEELEITNIHQQYDSFCNLIKEIPLDKEIIICPGNHDMVHLAEPQPAFYKEYAPGLFSLPNVTLVTNPAMVNIGKTLTFPGFDILMYHGYSFDYYAHLVESIRNNGGYNRADLLMKFLLKRRHLAPSYTSTPYYPAHAEDPLLIKKIPDFFITGHIHYSKVANYKGVTLICGSCWQSKTSFQEKLGHEPEPGRVPWVDLKTRGIKVLKFV